MIEIIMTVIILSNIALLGLSLLKSCIRVVALQGMLMGAASLFIQEGPLTVRLGIIAAAGIVLKGMVFPHLLHQAIKDAGIKREIEPYIGYMMSAFLGVVLLAAAVALGAKLPLPISGRYHLVIPVSFLTMFTGLLVMITRKKALTQVLGFLVLENGIYIFGLAIAGEIPFLVEIGLLIDVFFAVLVMGIAIYHINREFDHMDTDKLSRLQG